jgi:hypothetical protein
MYNLFVGDVDASLACNARAHDSQAFLLCTKNYTRWDRQGTVYTCIADMASLDDFFDVCKGANKIFYRPPIKWSGSDSDQQLYTEAILSYVSQFVNVDGLDSVCSEYKFLQQEFQQDQRKTKNSQLWIAGCSIAAGVGVDRCHTFKHLLSLYYNQSYSDLSAGSSSIIWQSDQICRADINPGDKVFWAVTGNFRLPVIQNQKLTHLLAGKYTTNPELAKDFPIELLNNQSLIYHNVMAIRRAENFCKKVGARLVMLGVIYDWDNFYIHYKTPSFKQSTSWPNGWVDLGHDNLHPGIKQHQLFAQEFIDWCSELSSQTC